MLENPNLISIRKHGSCHCHYTQKKWQPYSAPCWWWVDSSFTNDQKRFGEWPELLAWWRAALPI